MIKVLHSSASEAPIEQHIIIRWAALAGIIGPVMFALLIALLDILHYNFLVATGNDPLTKGPVSVNAWGQYGWLQDVNFVVFGLLEIIFALGLQGGVKSGGIWTKIGSTLLIVFGMAMLFSGFPIEDVHYGAPHSVHGWIHFISFFVFLGSSIPACFFVWLRLREDPLWRGYDWYCLGTGLLAVLLCLLVMVFRIGTIFQLSTFYIFLAVILIWLTILAIRLWVVTGQQGKSGA